MSKNYWQSGFISTISAVPSSLGCFNPLVPDARAARFHIARFAGLRGPVSVKENVKWQFQNAK